MFVIIPDYSPVSQFLETSFVVQLEFNAPKYFILLPQGRENFIYLMPLIKIQGIPLCKLS